jgi:hypothetical protein
VAFSEGAGAAAAWPTRVAMTMPTARVSRFTGKSCAHNSCLLRNSVHPDAALAGTGAPARSWRPAALQARRVRKAASTWASVSACRWTWPAHPGDLADGAQPHIGLHRVGLVAQLRVSRSRR